MVLQLALIERQQRFADLVGVHIQRTPSVLHMNFAIRSFLASLAFTATVIVVAISLPASL